MRSETIHTAPAPGLGLPDELQGYHTLVPLEATAGDRRKLGSWYSAVYRAVNSTDGVAYALRRVEGLFIHPLLWRFRLNDRPF
jgi:PAB-dependent poly(A)-specific ribonuclease subunit 3